MTADGIERRPDIETAFNALLAKVKECTYYILLLDKQTIHYRTATRIVTIFLDLLYPLNFDILRLYIFDNNKFSRYFFMVICDLNSHNLMLNETFLVSTF